MKTFDGKVAVVTGAANGIGRSIAKKCVEEGMKVVLADIDESSLADVEQELREAGGAVHAVKTDVTQISDIQALAQTTLDMFGKVHLLCSNAGFSLYKRSWQMTLSDWQWVMGVNLWGVIYGINVFLPIMLEQKEEAHIVNTSSEAGIIGGRRNMAGYYATKTAVIALSESVYHELAETTPQIQISVFIPGLVRSNAWDPDRYRPEWLQNRHENDESGEAAQYEAFKRRSKSLFESEYAMGSDEAAEILFAGLRGGKFYIRTHPGSKDDLIKARIDDVLKGNNPTDRIPAYREKIGVK